MKYTDSKIRIILLFAVIAIAAFLRLYRLGDVPPSPDWDEASLGYNAYSILETGKDEYGKFLPVVLRSFDDYKPALYAYLIIPFIKIFGLSIISVRLPSVILGILSVFSTYYLVKELLGFSPKQENNSNKLFLISLLSAGLLAFSPWHIQFSRIAFESNVGLAFNIFAFLFFLKGLRKPLFFFFCVFFASLSIYVYQAEKVFVPAFLVALIFIFRSKLQEIDKKWLIGSLVLLIILIFPMISFILTDKNALLRAKGVSVFSDQTEFLKRNVVKLSHDKERDDKIGALFDNRRIEYAKSIISGYIAHFDLNWLFITGDISRHHAPYMGLLYIFELPLIFIGVYSLAFGNFDKKTKLAIFSYFLLAPLPASVTSGVPHAVRALNFLPMFQVFSGAGAVTALWYVRNIRQSYFRFSIIAFALLFLAVNFSYYFNQYFVQQNYFYSKEWQYGYKEAVDYIRPLLSGYDKVIISNQAPLDQSYIFFLFYLSYSPSTYQKETEDVSGGFKESHFFGKFEFRSIDFNKENISRKTIIVGRPNDFPQSVKVLKLIRYLDGEEAIKIVEI